MLPHSPRIFRLSLLGLWQIISDDVVNNAGKVDGVNDVSHAGTPLNFIFVPFSNNTSLRRKLRHEHHR